MFARGGAADNIAVQSAHSKLTPRVGGIGVVAAIVAAFLFVPSEALGPGFRLLALSLLPIFLAGLAEDLGFGVSVRGRLIAAA
ncbi:MAG: hypothetical protein Q8L58_00895, partial [Phaeovulum sp.]|nr:hypothetical protein [Phaeovulum sp.]